MNTLALAERTKPVRRIWIPKRGTDERRPLGIPTLRDRAAQALTKLALEPEWEAQFEPNSYGFRPGRSAHDAIAAIFNGMRWKEKYVLDADIAKCFDHIDHAALLRKLNTTTALHHAIKAWLKAGVLDGDTLFPTEEGTPQGGVISPLLANVALHGFETAVRATFPDWTYIAGKRVWGWKPQVIRYADDFIIMHPDHEVIHEAQRIASEWLATVGLELKPSKTRITHTLRGEDRGEAGFDFLGFTVRQFPVGKYHTGKAPNGHPLGFKTIITPSRDSRKRHRDQLREIIRTHHGTAQGALIGTLNPVIRGWSNYFATVVAKQVFSKEDEVLYRQLYRWTTRRHQNKHIKRIVRKYWQPGRYGKWTFSTKEGEYLHNHAGTSIRRHEKVQGDRSPFDGDWGYWGPRLSKYAALPQRVISLLRKQGGCCAWCGLHFRSEDVWEVDHIVPRSQGGKNLLTNAQLLHGHCHDQKTVHDMRGQVLLTTSRTSEEPDEAKGLTSGSERGAVG